MHTEYKPRMRLESEVGMPMMRDGVIELAAPHLTCTFLTHD
jgi:hypothetical protein